MLRSSLWCACLAACGLGSPAVDVKPGEHLTLSTGVNGDVRCDGGAIDLPVSASINGDLDSSDCELKIAGIVNGAITATGGLVHVIDVPSVNGALTVDGAYEVYVAGSDVNGGLDIEHSGKVAVLQSRFNGDGNIVYNGDIEVDGNSFNGSLTIQQAASCSAGNNDTNGTLSVADCQ